jgi:GAF domain-containing protein
MEERARQLAVLYRASTAASRELDLDKALATTLPLIVDIVGATAAEVHLVDEDGCLTWVAGHGLPDSYVGAVLTQRVPPRQGLCD